MIKKVQKSNNANFTVLEKVVSSYLDSFYQFLIKFVEGLL